MLFDDVEPEVKKLVSLNDASSNDSRIDIMYTQYWQHKITDIEKQAFEAGGEFKVWSEAIRSHAIPHHDVRRERHSVRSSFQRHVRKQLLGSGQL